MGKNLGHATAYAYAKAGGYTGTEEEFQAEMAAATASKDAAAGSASAAAGSAGAAEVSANLARTFTGAPRVAATAAAMTDHDLIYVYTGSETGYTAGNWYYWDGTAWASGGVYNSTALETDDTLTISGAAADAKATGDAVGEVKSAINELNTGFIDWSKYGLTSNIVTLDNNAKRAHSNLCRASDDLQITANGIPENYTMIVYATTSTSQSISGRGINIANGTPVTITANNYYRFVLRSASDQYDANLVSSVYVDVRCEQVIDLTNELYNHTTENFHIKNSWHPYVLTNDGRIKHPTDNYGHATSNFLKISGTTINFEVASTYQVAVRLYDSDFAFVSSYSSSRVQSITPPETAKYAKIVITVANYDTVENIIANCDLQMSGVSTEFDVRLQTNASRLLTQGPCTDAEMENNCKALNLLEDIINEGGGGTIVFEAGEYWFPENDYILLRSNVSVIGAGIGSTILKKMPLTVQPVEYTGMPLFTCKNAEESPDYPIENFEHRDFTIDFYEWELEAISADFKAYAGYYCKHAIFSNLEILGTPATGFGIDYCHDVLVTNCIFKDCGRFWGLTIDGTLMQISCNGVGIMTGTWDEENIIVTNNVFDGCGRHGVYFERHTANLPGSGKGQIVSNNIIKNGRWCGIGLYAVSGSAQYVDTINISNNHIYNCRGAGIHLRYKMKNIIIVGNTVVKCGTSAEHLNDYNYNISGADYGGIRKIGSDADGYIVQSNIIRDTEGPEIKMYGGGQYVSIQNNMVCGGTIDVDGTYTNSTIQET